MKKTILLLLVAVVTTATLQAQKQTEVRDDTYQASENDSLVTTATLQAQKKTFVREYTYQASEEDSRNTSRNNATRQMRKILLWKIGEFLHVERTITTQGSEQEYLEKIEAITAGIIEMKVLDEQWDGATFYIKAEMTVDPTEVKRRIDEILNDKQQTKELEESRRRTLEAEAEIAKTKKELENARRAIASAEAEKDKLKKELAVQKSQALKATYAQQVEKLSAEEYFTIGNYTEAIRCYQRFLAIAPNDTQAYYYMGNAYYNIKRFNEAIRCYQKAIAIDPNYATAYANMGLAYRSLGNNREEVRCYQKAAQLGHSGYQELLRKNVYSL